MEVPAHHPLTNPTIDSSATTPWKVKIPNKSLPSRLTALRTTLVLPIRPSYLPTTNSNSLTKLLYCRKSPNLRRNWLLVVLNSRVLVQKKMSEMSLSQNLKSRTKG